jgi:prepilin-type N-terminal cleavage/methylation domain-containing protein
MDIEIIMKSQAVSTRRREHRARGFSLIEMVSVVAISLVLTVVSVVSLMPALNAQHVTNAYNTTLSVLRQARDNAVSQRTAYEVSFVQTTTPPVTSISILPTTTFAGNQNTVTYKFPTDVFFLVPPSGTAAPDSFGTGSNAIDFGYTANGNSGGTTQTIIYFCPDGSAQTTSSCSGAGNWDGGAVYLGRNGDNGSYRAISLYGGTGRIHGWRLYTNGAGGYQWLRQ